MAPGSVASQLPTPSKNKVLLTPRQWNLTANSIPTKPRSCEIMFLWILWAHNLLFDPISYWKTFDCQGRFVVFS